MKQDPRKRYSLTDRFSFPDGVTPAYDGLLPRRVTTKPGYVRHMVVEGDRLDRLAHQYYGDPRYWWVIVQANPGLLEPSRLLYGVEPDSEGEILNEGIELQIPPKPQEAE